MDFENPELPFDEQDARLEIGIGLQREIDHPLDHQAGRDLDDQRVLARIGRIAARPGRRAEIGGKLRLQAFQREIDPQVALRGCFAIRSHVPALPTSTSRR